MESVEKKVVEIRKNLLRIMDLKKKMIDCEVSWLQMIRMLELTQYEAIKFKNRELPEAEKRALKILENTPKNIIERDNKYLMLHRVKKENGLQDYLKEIDEAVKSNNYSFVFISQTPDVVKGVINLGYDVHLVKP